MTQLFEAEGARLEAQQGRLLASGDLDFSVAPPLAAAGHQWLEQQSAHSVISIDMCGVDRVSSAAVSVVLDWMRGARQADIEIKEVVLSTPLKRLTELAGLDALLPGNGKASENGKAPGNDKVSEGNQLSKNNQMPEKKPNV